MPGGVQGLDRYAYVNNSPMNYVDPSGHEAWWCNAPECQANYSNSMANTGGGQNNNSGTNNQSGDEEEPTYGDGLIGPAQPPNTSPSSIYGPPAPLACFRNSICMETPNIIMSPSDVMFLSMVGRVIIYSPEGKVIGLKEIYVRPNLKSPTVHLDIVPQWIGRQIIDNIGVELIKINLILLLQPEAAAAVDVASKIQTAYDVINLADKLVTFRSNGLKTGPYIPVINAPIPNIATPFDNFP